MTKSSKTGQYLRYNTFLHDLYYRFAKLAKVYLCHVLQCKTYRELVSW